MDWPERFSAALDVELTDEEIDAILDLARDVAHGTERRFAPVSAYIVGRYAGRCAAEGGIDIHAALREATEIAGRLLDQA